MNFKNVRPHNPAHSSHSSSATPTPGSQAHAGMDYESVPPKQKTGHLLKPQQGWTLTRYEAVDFEMIFLALEFCISEQLRHVSILPCFGNKALDMHLDPFGITDEWK